MDWNIGMEGHIVRMERKVIHRKLHQQQHTTQEVTSTTHYTGYMDKNTDNMYKVKQRLQ